MTLFQEVRLRAKSSQLFLQGINDVVFCSRNVLALVFTEVERGVKAWRTELRPESASFKYKFLQKFHSGMTGFVLLSREERKRFLSKSRYWKAKRMNAFSSPSTLHHTQVVILAPGLASN